MFAVNKKHFEHEQKCIHEALNRLVDSLPANLQPVAKHVLEAGGKRLRPLLVSHFAAIFGHSNIAVYDIGAAVEVFHVATLLHDDVIDNAVLRRGKPCAHQNFGVSTAILVGDALLAAGSYIIAMQGIMKLSCCAATTIVQTAHGEVLEIEEQGKIPPDLTQYFAIITGKTACMIQAACEFGVIAASGNDAAIQAARDFGINLGIAFQIIDDVLDFSPSKETGKPAGGDLREGKYTVPIHSYVKSLNPLEYEAFAEKFAARSFTDADINELVNAVCKGGFLNESRALADSYLDKTFEALSTLRTCGADPKGLLILEDMVKYVGKRTK